MCVPLETPLITNLWLSLLLPLSSLHPHRTRARTRSHVQVERVTADPSASYEPRMVLQMLHEPMPDGSAWQFDPRPIINVRRLSLVCPAW